MESSNLICQVCKKLYNLTSREPLTLFCCGEDICRACHSILAGPQEQKVECPFCKTELNRDQQLPPSKVIKRAIQQSSRVNIYCSEHKDKEIEFYCKTHKSFICTVCAIQFHGDHNNDLVKFDKKDIDSYWAKILELLKDENKRICRMIETFTSYQDGDTIFQQDEFQEIIGDAQATLAHSAKTDQQRKDLQFLDCIQIQEAQIQPQNQIAKQIETPGSTLLKSEEDIALVKKWIGGGKVTLTLLFKGSVDGFTSAAFHPKCDNQGPTLTVIKSDSDKIFGGYTQVSWSSPEVQYYYADEKAFLFSLTHKTKHLQYQNKDQALYHNKNYLCVFGGNECDIQIRNDCRQGISYSDFGHTYQPPDGIKHKSEEAKKYLAGSYVFKVIEIEVYKVEFN